jgi:hypothetical protein
MCTNYPRAIRCWISHGALPVVVTLLGWLILAKGLLLRFLKPVVLSGVFEGLHYGENHDLYLAPAFVIGLYLTWAGFTASIAREPKERGVVLRANTGFAHSR